MTVRGSSQVETLGPGGHGIVLVDPQNGSDGMDAAQADVEIEVAALEEDPGSQYCCAEQGRDSRGPEERQSEGRRAPQQAGEMGDE